MIGEEGWAEGLRYNPKSIHAIETNGGATVVFTHVDWASGGRCSARGIVPTSAVTISIATSPRTDDRIPIGRARSTRTAGAQNNAARNACGASVTRYPTTNCYYYVHGGLHDCVRTFAIYRRARVIV